ncbi:uncharacterized protein [Musca autumnalis]|uniref:uncharacterized protein n=1 Tax=Musca autumnalis TaxID=221902 RepID=UPI003CEBCDCD
MVDSTRQLRRRNPINYKEVDSNSSEDEAEFFESSNIVTDNNMAEDLQRQIQSLREQLAALSSATRHEDTRPNLQKVHIPKFNERNPHLWFAQVERSFALCNITADNDKFDLVSVRLEDEVLLSVEDLITNPPDSSKYLAIKERIISKFAESPESKLRRLIQGGETNGMKPTSILAHMKRLAPGKGNEAIIRTLFLVQMPENMRPFLTACEEEDLEKLAKIADKMFEANNNNCVNSLSTSQQPAVDAINQRMSFADMCQTIRELSDKVDKIQQQIAGKLTGLSSVKSVGDSSNNNNACEKRLHLYDKSTNSRYLIDFGSAVSVVPPSIIKEKLKPSKLTLLAANQSEIKTFGDCVLKLDLGLRREFKWLYVIADVHTPIIGADFLVNFDLLIDLKQKRLIDNKTKLSNQKPTDELIVVHHIETTGSPVADRPRRLSGDKLKAAKAEMDYLIEQGICRPSKSAWASPIHMVAKKTGGWRVCGDYRKLNSQTIPDRYPIAHIHDYAENLHDRIDAIKNYKKPETICELRRFIGVINYYRRCIPHAAHQQAPLNELVGNSKKNDKRKVPWTTESENAFEICKRSLGEATMLAHPAPDLELALVTDASDSAIGAVLEQNFNGTWRPLGFYSCKLSKSEKSYSTYDRELLAIYKAVKYFRHMLEARHFVIKTDYKPLIYAFSQRPEKASPRQLRNLDFISQFTTDIIYLSGPENTVADAFSRLNEISMPSTVSTEDIQKAQQSDDELKTIINGNNSLKLQIVHYDGLKLFRSKTCPLKQLLLHFGQLGFQDLIAQKQLQQIKALNLNQRFSNH